MDKKEINKMYKQALKLEKKLNKEKAQRDKLLIKEVKALNIFHRADKIPRPITKIHDNVVDYCTCPNCSRYLQEEFVKIKNTPLPQYATITKYIKYTCKCGYVGARIEYNG